MSLVDRFKNEDIVINCNTEGQVAALFNWCEENGIIVENQVKEYSFSQFGPTVCYRCIASSHQLFYANFNYYKNKGYTIIRYLDFFEKNTNTIKIKDIVEKYAEYEIDEDKLKELLIKPKQKTIWELEVGDAYNYISSDGNIVSSMWVNDICDKNRFAAGNCFLTKEAAQHELERRKIRVKLLSLGGREYYKTNSDNFTFCYCYDTDTLICIPIGFNLYGVTIYFDEHEECIKAMNIIGRDKIKKYWFNVEKGE